MLADQRNRSAFARYYKRQGAAHNLAGDDHDLALAGLRFGSATIDSLSLLVLAVLTLPVSCRPALAGTHRLAELCASTNAVLYCTLRSRLSCDAACPLCQATSRTGPLSDIKNWMPR
jgi:hypothetical protein